MPCCEARAQRQRLGESCQLQWPPPAAEERHTVLGNAQKTQAEGRTGMPLLTQSKHPYLPSEVH
eukprot:2463737-Pyramimonas_sp.AAC.1